MRTHGCDACGTVDEARGRAKFPDGWAAVRFVRHGHKPTNYTLCRSCATDLEHLLTGTRRGQTRIHRDPHLPPGHIEGSQ